VRCNVYGAETAAGHATPYGGLIPAPVAQAWYCPLPAEHRFRWVCANGHRGDIIELCAQHEGEMMGRAEARVNGQRLPIPWNVRRDVKSCPRCASLAPDCTDPDHRAMMTGRPGRCGCQEPKVDVRLVSVS
jgi:hypothetical protein